MSTTKIRKATPQSNKSKMWRRLATNGNGRNARNIMSQHKSLSAYPHDLLITMMNMGGISTPVYDENLKQMMMRQAEQNIDTMDESSGLNMSNTTDTMVTDVEVIDQQIGD